MKNGWETLRNNFYNLSPEALALINFCFLKLIENNVVALDAADRWFRHVLTIVFPDSRFAGVEIGIHADHDFAQTLAQF